MLAWIVIGLCIGFFGGMVVGYVALVQSSENDR